MKSAKSENESCHQRNSGLKRELYVILGDKCNMACSHCVITGSPRANAYQLVEAEIEKLVNLINFDEAIYRIHFTGGEPTLFMNEMLSLLSRLNRKIEVAMTTNGLISNKTKTALSTILFDEVFISFDKFRLSFINADEISAAIDFFKKNAKKISLKTTIENEQDLKLITGLISSDIRLWINEVTNVGRYSGNAPKVDVANDWLQKCPSSSETTNGFVFFPARGLTHCCGPLAYDRLGSDSEIFTELEKFPSNDSAFKESLNVTFSEVAKRFSLTEIATSGRGPCEPCKMLFAKSPGTNRSLVAMMEAISKSPRISTSSTIPENWFAMLEKSYKVKYLVGGTIVPKNEENYDFSKLVIKEGYTEENLSFALASMKGSDAYSNESEKNFLAAELAKYLPAGRSLKYYNHGKIIGMLSFSENFDLPEIGICKYIFHLALDNELQNPELRKLIKAHWLYTLSEGSNSYKVYGTIDHQNLKSMNHARSMGRKIEQVIIRRKK